jgi:hypothetical protein
LACCCLAPSFCHTMYARAVQWDPVARARRTARARIASACATPAG